MTISIGWDNDARDTIILRYQGAYTWEELDEVTNQMYNLLRSVEHQVDVVVLLDPKVKIPEGGNMMARFRSILRNTPKNLRLYINVGRGSAFSRAIANIALKLYRAPFEITSVGTEADARQLLDQRRENQKPITP